MAYDYLKAQAQVNGQIAKYGSSGTFVKLGSSSGYDDSGNPATGTPDVNVDGIVTPLLKYKKHEVDGTKIIVGDAYVYFDSDNDAALEVGMLITINGKTLRLVDVDKLQHESIVVYVKLQLRS